MNNSITKFNTECETFIVCIENLRTKSKIIYDQLYKKFYLEIEDIAVELNKEDLKEKVKQWSKEGYIIKQPLLIELDSMFSNKELIIILIYSTITTFPRKILSYIRELDRKIKDNSIKVLPYIISFAVLISIFDLLRSTYYTLIIPPLVLGSYNLIVYKRFWTNKRQLFYLIQSLISLALVFSLD